ncbi:MAG: hypothetical protein WCK51_00090 [Armatimonadota bacterium]
MKIARHLLVFSLVVVTSLALAQGGGGQGRGQGRGGFGQGRGGQMSQLSLLMMPAVRKDLDLSEEQITKVEALQPKRGQGGAGGGQRGQGGAGQGQGGGQRQGGGGQGGQLTDEQRAAMQEAAKKRAEEQKAAIAAILSPAQVTRLSEIGYQIQGNMAILSADTQKALGLDEKQIASIKELQTKQQEAMQALMEKARNQELTMEELQEKRTKNTDIMKAELGKILKADQAAKLKAMGGTKPFVADPA